MLVRLVNAVLQRFLGQYVENLDTERLSYSLGYSGNVVLTNLHLKANAFSHILGLPLRLKSGLIARVQLSIPLTQLRSQPWCITIEDADLVIYPSNSNVVATESAPCDATNTSADVSVNANIVEESRKAYLDRLESRWWQVVREGGLVDAVATTSPTDSSWWSYGVSLIYGVVSNLHVEIRNVHFSFVDENGLIGGHFTWGIRLERMTIQATDASWNPAGRSSNQQIEFKSIDIVGFSVYYIEEEKVKQYYLVPPSQFSVHLLRRTTPELLTSESTPRIEVEAKLTALDVDVSQGVLAYSRRLMDFFQQQSGTPHRPLARPLKQPAAWWRYAAGEVVPALRRSHRNCRSSDLMLQRLAEAAAVTNRYVRAYEAHLLQGLGLDSDGNFGGIEDHEVLEETMSLDRVIILRQVAMRRAARVLRQQKPLVKRSKDPPATNNQRSQSWWPSFLTSTTASDNTATGNGAMPEVLTETVGGEAGGAPRPWRLWWWFSTAPPPPPPQTALNTEATMTTTAASAEAALMLLNELVAARDIGQVLTHDRLFCRLTCRVDRFRLGLQEKDDQSLCSLRADNLQLCVETRPREESLHFSAGLRSLLVRDERCRNGRQRPFFPVVISPLLHAPSSPSSDIFRLDYTSMQLANEASSPPASLTIRTDPLRVVCQPELFIRVVRLLAYVFNKSSSQTSDDSSTYDTIKLHTKANLRAALHNVETAVEGSTATTATSSTAATPLRTSLVSPLSTPSILQLHFDIAAPRILFPGRLWPSLAEAEAERESSAPCPPASLLGVICDLGRFRLSNWEPSTTTATNGCENGKQAQAPAEQKAEVLNEAHKKADYDEDDGSDGDEESDVFATPCGTPIQSDSETQQIPSPKRLASAQRRPLRKRSQKSRRLYVTYLLELDEFRILAGRLDELQVSGLWPDLLPKSSISNTVDGRPITQVASQVNLVDRFSLAIWITRRVIPMAQLNPSSTSNTTAPLPPPPPTIPTDLPGLLVCLEQRHCVLRLSDTRVAAVRLCLAAVALAAAKQMEEATGSHQPLLPAPMPQSLEIRRWKRSKQQIGMSSMILAAPALRRTIVITFSMHELILQLDARGRPLAECRLTSTAARFSRSTDAVHYTTTYDVSLQVHSLTIADALCGLGGDFDLLAASHRNVRLDTLSGSLNVSGGGDSSSTKRRSQQQLIRGSSNNFTVNRPFFDPIGDGGEDASTALIRVKYFQSSTGMKTSRLLNVKFRHLDLLGNLDTLVELIAFVRCVIPVPEPRSEPRNLNLSTAHTASTAADSVETGGDDGNPNISDSLEMSISVERLSLVLIRVKGAPEAEDTTEGSGVMAEEGGEYAFSPPSATAERIATITLLGVHFQSQDNYNNLRVSLAGLQVLDLMEVESSSALPNRVQHRHIFAAGSCLDPELPDAMLAWSAAKSVFTLTARCYSASGYQIMLEVSSPVYVHKPRALHEISAWFSRLYHRNTEVGVLALRLAKSAVNSAVAAATAPPQQHQLAPSSSASSRIASLHAIFEQPVIVLPAGPVSPHVLIARLGRLMLRNGNCGKDVDGGDRFTPLRFVQLSVAHASLSALDISDERGVPRVRDTSEAVQAMLVLAHFLGLVTSPMEHCVLKDISADIMVKRQILSRPRSEMELGTINWPDDFNPMETSFPFGDDEELVLSEEASSKSELWITMSACLTQPLHVRLSKSVYHQLLQTMNNLIYFGDVFDGDDADGNSSASSQKSSMERINTVTKSQSPVEEAASDVMMPGLAMRFRMPLLVVETFTEMSGEAHPLGLTRLSLCEFFVAASRVPSTPGRNDGSGLTHIEATLASLLLENLLPGYSDENRYLLYSHLPSKSQPSSSWSHRRPRPLAASCPSLIESSSWISLTDAIASPFPKSLQRAPLSIGFGSSDGKKEEEGLGSKVMASDRCMIGQLRHLTEEKKDDREGDQFVRIRVLLVDQSSPLFTTKYQSTHGFVDVAFSSLTCYFSLHPWVLLLDFLGLGSPLTACDEFDAQTTSATPSSSSNTALALPATDGDFQPAKGAETLELEAKASIVITLSVSAFSLLLDTVPKGSCPASPLLRASASRLHIRLTNHSRHIDAGGGWLHIAGRLASASVHDLTSQELHLYPQRFLAGGGGGGCGDYLVFALTKYQLPDPEATRRAEDGRLELTLGPAYYVHTQAFLATTIHTLDSFLQYQDLMNRVRASSEGYKVRQGAPISMRLRLDVKAEAPILVVPVSPTSESVLVCNLGTLTAVNDFYWHTDIIGHKGGGGPSHELSGDNLLQHYQEQPCKHCSSNLWWCDDLAGAGSKDMMTQSFYPTSAIAKDATDTDQSPCLLDRIHLNLDQIEVYVGKRHDVRDAASVECSRVLHFNEFCILPEAAALTQLFGLSIVVERNLCGGRGQHAVPDWRLSARLRPTSPLHIGLHDYTLLRGILEHNIAAPPPASRDTANTFAFVTSKSGGSAAAASDNYEPGYTRRPYRALSFTFDLEDVSIYLSVPSDWPSQRHVKPTHDASFCRLDLTRSRLSYDSFSCGGHVIDLACTAVTFTDTRFESCVESRNLFPAILSALAKPQQHHHESDTVTSPQFRVNQVVTSVGGGIGTTTSATTSSSMTFNLRSMRLILALDWLVDLHRFLTTPPMLPASLSSASASPPPTDSLRGGGSIQIGGECNNHLRSPLTAETNQGDEQQQKPMSRGTSDLRVFADQTEFVIMENPAQLETNTAVLSGAMCFLLRSGGALSQALMHLCLHGVGLYTFTGRTDDSRAVIVEPTDLTVALTPPTTQNTYHRQASPPVCGGLQDLLAPRADLEVRTSTLRTHFSYTDSLLFLALLDSFREQTAYAFGSSTATTDSAFTPPFKTGDTSFDHSIAKLVEMGFSAEAAAQALHATDGRLDRATFVLVAPQPPNAPVDPPQSRVVLWLRSFVDQLTPHVSNINFYSDFSLCLIDDCMDADVPLAEVTVSDISLNWNLTGWAVGRVMGRLAVKYYNRDLSALEPAIESFRCICHWRLCNCGSSKGDSATIEVHSPDTINVNLTVALVRLTQLVIQKIQSTRLDRQLRPHRRRRRAPFVPFCLANQTGETLRFKKATVSSCFGADDEGGEWTPVEVDACVELPFQSALAASGRGQGQVQGRGRVAHSTLTTTPRLFLQVEGWTPAYPVALDRLGVFWRTIRLQQRQNYKLSPVTRLVIEIVRRGSAQNLVIVRSGLTLTNRLSPHLALEVGLAYTPPFPSYSANASAVEASGTATVVVRSAVRLAFGETRALPLSMAARSNEDGGERLCFRPVCVTNGGTDDTSHSGILFDWSQQLCLQHFDNRGTPEVELKFPTSLKEVMDWRRLTNSGDFDECVMVCRRLKSGSEIGLYSATVASPKRSASRSAQKQLPWLFCVTAVRDSFPPDPLFREVSLVLPGHHLTVGPALRIVNLLPCDLTYFIEGTPIRSCLPANKAASVFEVGCTSALRFGVHLENFQRCEPINIPPATFSDTVLINLFDQFGRLLQLKAEVYTRALGARHVTLSAVCWLINHSGLPLVFAAEAPSSLASFSEWQAPGSPEHRLLAAGQSEEQEVARLASPLPFSPVTTGTISGNSTGVSAGGGGGGGGVGGSGSGRSHLSWSLQVRLGALYQPSEGGGGGGGTWLPRWSAPVALNKNGEALMLRLKAMGMESRPDLLYSVGVEVRKGVGLHNATTIVTFVPRFMISNQTNFQLQFAQRFCLESSTYEPMDIHPQCNLPFHWLRQDLDQLLCFRALIGGETWLSDHQAGPVLIATHWSGGVQIDKPRSYHLMLRMPTRPQTGSYAPSIPSLAESLFIRIDVVLRSATFFVIISDATHLPPPYRIENCSPVALYYQQSIDNGGFEAPPPPSPTTRSTSRRWFGSARLNRLPPRSMVNYAPEEPLLPPRLSIGVQGDLNNFYDLSTPGPGSRLVYDNCLYIGISGVAGDDSRNLQDSDINKDSGGYFPVLDVITESEKIRRVVLRKKQPGERSQLWYLSSQGFLVHEGSTAPQAPIRRSGRLLSKRNSWVLDVDTSEMAMEEAMNRCPLDSGTLENFELGVLCLSRLTSRRKNTQTWRFDRGFLINAASFCVQARRSLRKVGAIPSDTVFVARPRIRGISSGGRGGVKGERQSLVSESLGAARIFHTWLRPGSGSLHIEVLTDGPVRVLRISDPQEPDQVIPALPLHPHKHSFIPPSHLRLLLDLPSGIGVSVISARCEELCYASLLGLRFALERYYPGGGSVDVGQEVTEAEVADDDDTVFVDVPDHSQGCSSNVRDEAVDALVSEGHPVEQLRLQMGKIQIDNQIAGASLPVLLFNAAPIKSSTASTDSKMTSKGVVEGRLLRPSEGGDDINGRELERLFQTGNESTHAASKPNRAVTTWPNLIMRSLRLLHTGWKAEIFALLEVQLNRMVMQAEELLLLKLIQFGRQFWTSTPTAIMSTEDAKSIDFLQQAVLEAEGSYSRQVSPPSILSDDFLYFDRLRVLFSPIRVTMQTAEGRLGPEFYDVHRLLPKLMSFTDADIRLGEFAREHCLEPSRFLAEQLAQHFEARLKAQALRIFGSVDVLGNPLGLMSDISSGICDLADMDFSGLVRNVAHGVGDSTAKVVGSVSQLVHTLSMDETHQLRRRVIMGSPRRGPGSGTPLTSPSSIASAYAAASRAAEGEVEERLDDFEVTALPSVKVAEGNRDSLFDQTAPFRAGLRGFVHGVVGGVTSMVTQPIHGACEEDGLKGFVYGVGRGLLGTVTKPVGGVLDLVSGAMTSLREAARPSSTGRPRRMRPRRALSMPLRAYSLGAAVGQLLLRRLSVHSYSTAYEPAAVVIVSLDDLKDSEGCSVNRLLKASRQQWEDERPEMVICVLKCQSATVSVIITDRAVWCVRNFTLPGVKRTSESFFGNEDRDATNVMFVVPYFYLKSVRLSQHVPGKTKSGGPQGFVPSGAAVTADSSYLEFQLERRQRELRFDRVEWAQDVLTEVWEAHFRYVQSLMELRRDRPVDLALQTHPLALPFGPPPVDTAHFAQTGEYEECVDE
ncbi:Vacuolar protein sorting-associated protein 13D [Taenia crassiceps]|uniref:Vacuolar protein sorting-associated protein 13D n=1 Tax=Taenia crassiceps TaxID=6207 RepID=A0ABR4Q065_9CEST